MNELTKNWYSTWWGRAIIAVLSIIIIVILAFGVYLLVYTKNLRDRAGLTGEVMDPALWEKIQGTENNYFTGAEDPRLVIVEFSDFTCPFCKNSYTTIREIGRRFGEEVKIIYRDYPVLSETSVNLALAARCAGEQGLFWNMHDKLFQHQGISEKEEVEALANQVGVNLARFNDCIDSQRYYADIAQDLADAKSVKISGTPTWFIGGQRLEGEVPRDMFIYIIEHILKTNQEIE
jgi:protein-disulfide isomerase